MLRSTRTRSAVLVVATMMGCVLSACGDDDGKKADGNEAALCNSGTLESDLDSTAFMGPAVDPATGEFKMEPGVTYVVSSTYGTPVPGPDGAPVTQRYLELFSAIEEQLQKEPGLLAMKLANSDKCGSGRTLAVWKSEEEMYDFVTSAAHLAAMDEVSDVLKPGYGVTHWNADSLQQTTWEEAVRRVKADN